MYNSDHTATECIGQKYFFFSSLLNQLMSSLDSFIQLCFLPGPHKTQLQKHSLKKVKNCLIQLNFLWLLSFSF